MDYTQVLLKPVVSEKATFVKDETGHVVFYVHPQANKIEIKKAVEAAFQVKVTDVNVTKRSAAARSRMGRKVGRVPGYKKAYVKLAAGEKIEIFEGV